MSIVECILLDIVVGAFPEVSIPTITLDVPPKKELGDFAFNVFPYAKVTKLTPLVIAEKVAAELKKHSEYFKDVSIMGGYVNFSLTNKSWADIFKNLSTEQKPANNETVVVDYIGSNIGKPLHIGHMCTPVIGQSIINIHRHLGYKVIGDNHLGDWGGIFGKLIVWLKMEEMAGSGVLKLIKQELSLEDKKSYEELMRITLPSSNEEAVQQVLSRWSDNETDHYNGNELRLFSDVYIFMTYAWECDMRFEEQFRREFKKLSENDFTNIIIWRFVTEVSVEALVKLLNRLNIKSDFAIGESFYEGFLPKIGNHPNLVYNMRSVVEELVQNWVATKNEDGSVGVVFPEETKIPSCVLAKRDGTHGYLASDLATIKYRMTNGWNPSKILYCIDNRQQLHLKQCFWIAKQAWPELLSNVEFAHVSNGAIRLKEGAMSSRKWRIIPLDTLLDEGINRTDTILQEKGQSLPKKDLEAISIGAIKYSYLAVDREKDIIFDWDKALSFEGNSGPYIQYSYVRAKNIVEKAGIIGTFKSEKLALSEYDRACLRRLSFFDKAVQDSATKYKPHILATYCYELASEFNAFYVHTPKILEEQDTDLRNFRLNLIGKVSETLKKGFELLAIEMPGKM